MKVIKPKLTTNAMCVYKFTLNNGFYYYGGTTDLGDRIYAHLMKYKKGLQNKLMENAFKSATSIKFEIIRYINDRGKIKLEEEKYLKRHVGLPKCLNTDEICTNSFRRGKALSKIAKCDLQGNILEIYETATLAAKSLGINRMRVETATHLKYPRTEYALRKLNSNGELIIPIKPYREYPSLSKPVSQFDKQMNFIATFRSIEEAGRQTGCDRKGISDVVNKRAKTCKGFIFKAA